MNNSGFTGRRRQRRTRWSVKFKDVLSRVLITVGGVGTIIAVSLVAVFLVWAVAPLFLPASAQPAAATPPGLEHATPASATAPEHPQTLLTPHLAVDEFRVLGLSVTPEGELITFRMDNGRTLERRRLFTTPRLTAWAFADRGDHAAFGFADGSLRLGTLGFDTLFLHIDGPDAAEPLRKLDEFLQAHMTVETVGELKLEIGRDGQATFVATASDGRTFGATLALVDEERKGRQFLKLATKAKRRSFNSVITRTPIGQFRFHVPMVTLDDPIHGSSDQPVVLVDQIIDRDGPRFAVLTADNHLRLGRQEERLNMMTYETEVTLSGVDLPYTPRPDGSRPAWLMLNGLGDNVYLAWADGFLVRFDCRTMLDKPMVAEQRDLVPEPNVRLTALRWLIGRATLVAGDSLGRLNAWFRVRIESSGTSDGQILKLVHPLAPPGPAPVTAVAPSQRGRTVAVGFADGRADLYQVTTESRMLELAAAPGSPVEAITLPPKDDGLVVLADGRIHNWNITAHHPEATFASIFAPVWYEGHDRPKFLWQTVGGDDAAEPKFSLVNLVFGTLKATFYSMLFAIPIALLAAIYTSEFLHPKIKGKIKPTIELMASLPSVVLGFLGGLVIAQYVEDVVPTVLASFYAVPFAFLLGAHLWQLLPSKLTIRLDRVRLLFVIATLVGGVALARWGGPWMQQVLFHGDLKAWLKGNVPGQASTGSGWPGWFLLGIPLSAILVALLTARMLNPRIKGLSDRLGRGLLALLQFAKFAVGCGVTVALAAAVASGLTALGMDPRGGGWEPMGVYVQRNALIVGFMMGFAVIPIIYTIAEDALSTVPEHLRSASLGAGATPWQTAVRIVIPTAMSGLFSAVMIGLGRAVGETMIVLMAAGNTPILEWNVFNGFETLSAAIAVEMPEAVRDSTHYRMLFLAGLTLFVMTFALNTVAELIRLRFRRRAYQL